MATQGERIASVEVEVKQLSRSFEEHKDHTDRQFEELKEKLDELLVLRHKGAGAFWLASMLLGTGVIGLFTQLTGWLRGA